MPTIDPLFPIPLIAILFAGVFLYIMRSYLKIEKGSAERRSLIILRLLSILVLLIVCLRPRLEFSEEKTQKDRLYFLYDRSLSMTIKDMPGRKARADYMDSLVQKENQEIIKLKDKFDLKEYSFATDLEKNAKEVIAENSTSLGSALYTTAIDSRIRKVKGIILFSDGINTGGTSINRAVSELKRRNIPVHTIVMGQYKYQGNIADGVIVELDCPQSVKRGKVLKVKVHGIARGLKNFPIKMAVSIDDKVVKEVDILPETEESHFFKDLELDVEDFDAGYRKLSAKLITGEREISPANNVLDTYFQIKEGGLKVLLIATSPSPDYKFLKRVVSSMDEITITAPNPFTSRTENGKEELKNLKVEDFDVILLINPDLDLLPIEFIQKCEAFMKARKQGLLISGELFLQSLFKRNLLTEYIPVEKTAYTFERMESYLQVTPSGETHFVTQFFTDEQKGKLPAISGRTSTLKPSLSSKVLIQQNNVPILVFDQVKRCRVAWVNTDGLWQWMTDPTFKQNYQQLWKRTIYHLAHREADLSANLAIFTGKTRYKSNEKISVNADLIDDKGSPVLNANITLSSKLDKENSEENKSAFNFKRGLYSQEFFLRNGGLYTLKAQTTHNEEKLDSNEIKVFIQEPRIEFERILADKQLMNKVAEVTRGKNITPIEFNSLLKELQQGSKVRSVRTVTAKKDAWDNIFTYLLAALFLSLEWFKRRKIGLA